MVHSNKFSIKSVPVFLLTGWGSRMELAIEPTESDRAILSDLEGDRVRRFPAVSCWLPEGPAVVFSIDSDLTADSSWAPEIPNGALESSCARARSICTRYGSHSFPRSLLRIFCWITLVLMYCFAPTSWRSITLSTADNGFHSSYLAKSKCKICQNYFSINQSINRTNVR